MGERVAVPGLSYPVEIVRDANHVPHVAARTFRDGVAGLGFAMACDRLWQMDVLRRLGRGRAAEVLGRMLLPVDALVRTVDLDGAASAALAGLDADTRAILESFSAGVNACLERRRLPVEFELLGYSPEPWQPEDTVAIEYFAAWGLAQETLEPKLVLARALGGCGPDAAGWLYPEPPPASWLDPERLAAYRRLDLRLLALADSLAPASAASNNWAISGARSGRGRPILANDPHLIYAVPTLWYLAHVSSPEVDLLGAFYCGGPAAQVGRNRYGAWGVTNLTADDLDPVVEHVDAEESGRGAGRRRPQAFVERRADMAVRGEGEVRLRVGCTRNGPLLGPALDVSAPASAGALPLAIRWAPLCDPGSAAPGWMAVNLSRGLEDVAAAARRFSSGPVQMNLLYAETGGRIAHFAVGRVPDRQCYPSALPPLGWREEGAWRGYINLGSSPWAVDPPSGVLCSANERNAPGGLAPQPFGEFPARARRIRSVLEQGRDLSPADSARLQLDVVDLLARENLAALAPVLRDLGGLSPLAARARDLLVTWDGVADASSPGATVYHLVFYTYLPATLFPAEVYGPLAMHWRASTWALHRILGATSSPWFPSLEEKAGALARCLEEAARWLGEHEGEDPAAWAWGRIHGLTLAHPLAFLEPLSGARVGPLPLGGTPFTVNQQRFLSARPPFSPVLGPGVRMVVDLAEESAYFVLSTGQSGDPRSPHFADHTPLWHAGRLVRIRMAHTVRESAGGGVWLEPERARR